MIVEKAQKLTDLTERLRAGQRGQDHKEALETRLIGLARLEDDLRAAAAFLEVARRRKLIETAGIQIDSTTAIARLKELLEKFAADPASIISGNAYRDTVKLVGDTIEICKVTATTVWRDYTATKIERGSWELLDLYEKAGLFYGEITRLRELTSRLNTLASKPWVTEEELEMFERTSVDLKQAWRGIRADDLPTSVRRFLVACHQGGATLDLLIPEVMEWLKAKHVAQHFRIRPG